MRDLGNENHAVTDEGDIIIGSIVVGIGEATGKGILTMEQATAIQDRIVLTYNKLMAGYGADLDNGVVTYTDTPYEDFPDGTSRNAKAA